MSSSRPRAVRKQVLAVFKDQTQLQTDYSFGGEKNRVPLQSAVDQGFGHDDEKKIIAQRKSEWPDFVTVEKL